MFDLHVWQRRFQEHLELRHFSSRTVEGYVGELKPFFAFLEGHGLDGLSDITRDTVEAYRGFLFYAEYQGRRLSVMTQTYRLSAIKTFLRFLARERYVLVDPGAGVELPRAPRLLPGQLPSEEEVERLLVSPDTNRPLGLRNRAMLELLYATGIRNSELCLLTLDAVDLKRRELHIQFGKGGKSRQVPMGEEAAHWLATWLLHGRPQLAQRPGEMTVFISLRGQPLSRTVLASTVAEAGFDAGFEQRITPHLLRHCCATHTDAAWCRPAPSAGAARSQFARRDTALHSRGDFRSARCAPPLPP